MSSSKRPDDDALELHIKLKLPSQLKQFMTTAIEVGKIGISVGKILIPLLWVFSMAIKHVEPLHKPVLLPDSIEQTK